MSFSVKFSKVKAIGLTPVFLVAACSIDVHLYDHGEGVGTTVNGAGAPAGRGGYGQLYFTSSPQALARVTLLSDGIDNSLEKVLGDTPLTIDFSPTVSEPIGRRSCGRTIIVMFEHAGFEARKLSHRLTCATSAEAARNNPNNLSVAMTALPLAH